MSNFWRKIQKYDQPIKPCICGVQKNGSSFYGDTGVRKALSPSKIDVDMGLIIAGGVVIALAILAPPLIPFIIISVIACILTALTIVRIIKKHKTICSVRWAKVALFGIGGWVSFL